LVGCSDHCSPTASFDLRTLGLPHPSSVSFSTRDPKIQGHQSFVVAGRIAGKIEGAYQE
jgi:hypothetical protein